MSIEKIRPRVIDVTGNYTFNDVTATGNLVALNANLGNIATANYVKTDNLQYANGVAWPIGGAVTASGSNTQVQFNNAGSLGSSANFVFDKSTNRLTVDNITANGAALTNITGANVSGTVGNANFAAYAGNITVAAQGNITSLGTLSSLSVTGNISSGNANLGNLVIANYYSGSGNNLSNIQGGNITGAVSYATTANAVAGANVSGAVTYAGTANAVSGSNVMGAVSYATTANAVAGGNVSGAVGLATYATTANAVAGANVSGEVAHATTANSVAGANVSGTVSSATTAGTVTTAAQGNITSVGTLTSLSVSGDISGANLTLSGNLIVSGTTTTVNSTTTRVVDPVIELGGGANGATLTSNDSKDRGTLLHYYTTAPVDAFMGWDSSNSEFAFGSNVTVSSEVTTFNTFGNVRAGFFIGNGSGLSGISAVTAVSLVNGNSNVVVAPNSNVTISVTSTANVVTVTSTGMNVAGNITTAGSGGNISGAYYVIASYFSGSGNNLSNIQGANVTGAVANATLATYATTANAVAVANVSGIGNIATINKDGNSSNVLYGNGVFAATAVTYNNSSVSTYLASFGSNTISTTGNANVGNLNATTQLVSSVATGTAPLNVTSTTRVANLNVAYANVSDYSVVTTQTTGTFYPVFVSGNTTANYAYASNANLSFNAATGNLTVGNIVATNIGNISSINKDGNSSNVLYGNGVFASVGSVSVASLANGTSNVNIAASGGNITMGVGGTAGVVTVTSTGVNIAGYANLGSGNLTTTGNILATKVGNASTILVGDGANITGIAASTAVSLINGNSNVVVAPNSNVTISVTSTANVVTVTGTGVNVAGYLNLGSGNLTTTGNILATKIGNASTILVGDGSNITGLGNAQSIVYGNSNVYIASANANISMSVANTANVVVVSTTTVAVNGTITSGNVFANAGTIGASALTGTLSTANQYNVNNVGTLGNLAVTTNITSGNIYANSGIVKGQYLYGDGSNLTGLGGAGYIYNGTSNVFIATANGNVSFTVGGFTNILTVTTTGANIGGYANVTGNLEVVGNVTSGNANLGNAAVANYFIGNLYGNANSANTVINATQSNITSVGTLTSLTVSGTSNLGSVGNVYIGGGAANYYLKTDGSGNLTWATLAGGAGGGASLTYTADTSPPASGNLLGDQWFNTTANVLYEYFSDGTASYWVDISSPTTTTTVPTTLNLANVSISGGSNNQAIVSNGAGGLSFANIFLNITAPISNTATGAPGQMAYSSGNLYVCVATNTWAKFSGTTSW